MKKFIIVMVIILLIGGSFKLYGYITDKIVYNQDPKYTLEQINDKIVDSNMFEYLNKVYDEVQSTVLDNSIVINIFENSEEILYSFTLENSILSAVYEERELTHQLYKMVYDAVGRVHGYNNEDMYETYNERHQYNLKKHGFALKCEGSCMLEIDINKKPPFIKTTQFNLYFDFIDDTVDYINKAKKVIAETNLNTYASEIKNQMLLYMMEHGSYPTNIDQLTIVIDGEEPNNCKVEINNTNIKITGCLFKSYSNINTCNYIDNKAMCN